MFTRLAVGLVQAFSPCVYHAQMIQQYFYFFTQIKGNLYCKKGTRNMNNTRQDDSAVFNCRALRLPRTNDSALFNCRGLGNSAVGYIRELWGNQERLGQMLHLPWICHVRTCFRLFCKLIQNCFWFSIDEILSLSPGLLELSSLS
jgi:hypothetical protein